MSEAASDTFAKDPSVVSQIWHALRRIMGAAWRAGPILVVMMIVPADWLTIYEPTKSTRVTGFQGASWTHLLAPTSLAAICFRAFFMAGASPCRWRSFPPPPHC